MLVYRLDDADESQIEHIFNSMDRLKVHFCVGDFNLDFSKRSIKEQYSRKTNLEQIVKKPTRFGVSRTNKPTKTIIDHIWTRPSLKPKCKVLVESVTCSDHERVVLDIDANIPPVSLKLPIPLDRFRRYMPKNRIDWTKFPCSIPTDIEVQDSQIFYDCLVNEIIKGCNHVGIKPREKAIFKPIFRFHFKKDTRQAKSNMILARKSYQDYGERLKNLDPDDSCTQSALDIKYEIYKKTRNRFHTLARRDRRSEINKDMSDVATRTKKCWELVKRANATVKGTAEELSDKSLYGVTPMAEFFQERSKIGLSEDTDLSIDRNFPYKGKDQQTHVDITINDKDIDYLMDFKPAADPDPDSLSMMIWNNLYFNNEKYKILIRKLFYHVFEKSHRIPGLEVHDVKLFLKVEKPTRKKDLRPVASLPSLPKRMLKHVYKQVKDTNLEIFYDANDFSAPGRGSQVALLVSYETSERGCNQRTIRNQKMPKNGGLPKNNKRYVTHMTCYDKSNAFNTSDRKILCENLALSGSARNIICNSVYDHRYFRVRTKLERSAPFKLETGGAQGQSGVAENFSSLTKIMKPPKPEDFEHLDGLKWILVINYVDDTSQNTTALEHVIDEVDDECERQMVSDCKKLVYV